MTPELGTFALLVALAATVWAALASLAGHRRRHEPLVRSGEAAVLGAFVALTVASMVLVALFLARDFSVQYVAQYSDSRLPPAYTVAAFWAGQDGSLLLWAWLLAGAGVLVIHRHRDRHRDLMPVVTLVLALVLGLLTALVVATSNPFATLPFVPQEGAGLNAMLQNWGQLYHPPATFLGYVGFTVPFAFSIAALVTGRPGVQWLRAARGWMVASWLLLGLGILLGAAWAYTELGWGGYWAWDPVENVSLLPWLTATAFLHAAAVQERRGRLRISSHVLAAATFVLTVFATFLVRSGVASSVHAFAESEAGLYLLGAVVVVVAVTAALIVWRLPLLHGPRDPVDGRSREGLVVATNGLLVAFALVVLWGTLVPVVASVVQGREATVGAPFFDRATVPFAILLLLLTGLCPLVAWRRAARHGLQLRLAVALGAGLTAGVVVAVLDRGRHPATIAVLSLAAFALTTTVVELRRCLGGRRHRPATHGRRDDAGPRAPAPRVSRRIVRDPRRLGGVVAHLGVVVLVVGITLDVTYRHDERHTLTVGEAVTVGGYVLTFADLDTEVSTDRTALAATLDVARVGGRPLGTVVTERVLGFNQDQPRTEVGVRTSVREDVYVILEDVDVEAGTAGFHVHLHPGVLWIWVGGATLVAGGLLALLPVRGRTVDGLPVPAPARRTPLHRAPPAASTARGEVRRWHP